MFAKITWLESADSYAVKLKKYDDSFECALCNSDGRVHSPTRYLCSIRPSKLKWYTVALDEPIVVNRKKEAPKEKAVAKKEVKPKKTSDEAVEAMEDFIEEYQQGYSWFLNAGALMYDDIQRVKNGIDIKQPVIDRVFEALENHNEIKIPSQKKLMKRTNKYMKDKNITRNRLAQKMGIAHTTLNGFLRKEQKRRDVNVKITTFLNRKGY